MCTCLNDSELQNGYKFLGETAQELLSLTSTGGVMSTNTINTVYTIT